jgi:hypothetical protein
MEELTEGLLPSSDIGSVGSLLGAKASEMRQVSMHLDPGLPCPFVEYDPPKGAASVYAPTVGVALRPSALSEVRPPVVVPIPIDVVEYGRLAASDHLPNDPMGLKSGVMTHRNRCVFLARLRFDHLAGPARQKPGVWVVAEQLAELSPRWQSLVNHRQSLSEYVSFRK